MSWTAVRSTNYQTSKVLTGQGQRKLAVGEVNAVVGFIQTRLITETNRVLIAAANVVAYSWNLKDRVVGAMVEEKG